jgi:hypothetical protein
VVLGYFLLASAYALSNRPFASPDEFSHYLKAVAVSGGELLGEPADYPAAGLSPKQQAWVDQASRTVVVPGALALPVGQECDIVDPTRSAQCLYLSMPASADQRVVLPNGTYQPTPYVLPGLAARLADGPFTALLLGRLANGVMVAALLGLALLCLTRDGSRPAALVGVLLALTPMTAFLSGSLNPSGPEVMAAVALATSLLAAGRLSAADRSALPWATIAVSGATLCLSRSTGPLWVAATLCLVVLHVGLRRGWAVVASHLRPAVAACVVVALAVASNRVWEGAVGPTVTASGPGVLASAREQAAQSTRLVREQIGVFNYLEFQLPGVVYTTWLVAVVAVVALVLTFGDVRVRASVLISLSVSLLAPIALFAGVLVHTGFDVQGRHVLPATAVALVIVGDALARLLQLDRRTWLTFVVAVAVASAHLIAFWSNARRHAVGVTGPWNFLDAATWSPLIGGWIPSLLLATASAVALVAGARVLSLVPPPAQVALTDHWPPGDR